MFIPAQPRFAVHPGPPLRVELDGDVDFAVRAELDSTLAVITSMQASDVTVDLSRVTYLASEGLAFLVQLNNHIGPAGYQITLLSPRPVVARVLHISGFDDVFAVHSSAA
jgi:anti-sigma B factor antagonist